MIISQLSFKQFSTLDYIRKLPINEQLGKYNEYLENDLKEALLFNLNHDNYGVGGNNIITCTDGMDVVFLVDYTSSMGAALNAIKAAIASIVSAIVTESANNYRLGLVLFDENVTDFGTSFYSSKPAYISLPSSQKYVNTGTNSADQWITAMEVLSQNNQSTFTTQLNILNTTDFPLGYGVQYPEPSDIGIDRIVNYNIAGAFRNDVSKLIILITDNPSSGTNDTNDAADFVFAQTLIANCNAKGIKVLLMKNNAGSKEPLETIALGTGGLVSPSFTPTSIISSIQNICTI